MALPSAATTIRALAYRIQALAFEYWLCHCYAV